MEEENARAIDMLDLRRLGRDPARTYRLGIRRGTVAYDAEDLERYKGLKLDVIARFTGDDGAIPAIHRDDLLIF